MIAPLQVIILLLMVAAFNAAPQRPPIHLSPFMVVLLVILAHGLLLIRGWRRFASVDQQLGNGRISTFDAAGAIQKTLRRLTAFNIMLLAADLWLFGFGYLVKYHWNTHHIPMLSSVIWLIAPVATWLMIWYLEYPLEVRIHNVAELGQADEDLPTHALPSRMQYVDMQFRHGMSLLVVLLGFDLLTIPFTALLERLNLGNWSEIASLLPAMILFLILPAIIVRYWRTTRLPSGPLRTRLEDLSRRKKVGFMDIRIWNTYYRIPNAAILGLLPWCRYFLLTDLLLERLEPQQVEAVFAHEVGHGYHRHIWWYLLTFTAADLLGTGISLWAGNYWSLSDNTAMLLNFSIVALLLVFGFSRVSRLCEHQADWFAARHIADRVGATVQVPVASAAEYLPLEDTVIDPLRTDEPAMITQETPSQAGARIFSESLTMLVGIANRPRDRAGWMHPSTQNRVALLAALAESPDRQKQFARRIWLMRLGILIAAATGAALTLWAASQ
ncbi:MAG: M48 family metalloprotease [Phycisphaerae bacterium]